LFTTYFKGPIYWWVIKENTMSKWIVITSVTGAVISAISVSVWLMYKQNVEWDVWSTEFAPKLV
jgi:hypothetical protein